MEKISSLEEQLKSNYSSLHNQLINHEEDTSKQFVEHSELIHNNNNNLINLLHNTDATYKVLFTPYLTPCFDLLLSLEHHK